MSTENPQQKRRGSRKAALAGQGKARHVNSNEQREKEVMGNTMDNLAMLHAQMTASAEAAPAAPAAASGTNDVQITAPHVKQTLQQAATEAPKVAVTAPVEPTTKPAPQHIPQVNTLEELMELVKAASAIPKILVSVPLGLIKGSPENHRDFRIDFNTFTAVVPPLPVGWKTMGQEEYLESAWEELLYGMERNGVLSAEDAASEKVQIGDLFGLARSIDALGLMSPAGGYLKLDGLSGRPTHIELTFGERRTRASWLLGTDRVEFWIDTTLADNFQDPTARFKRQAQRTAENSKNKELALYEKIRNLHDLYQRFRELKGEAVVDAMTNLELAAELGAHFDGLNSRSSAGRYLGIIRNEHADLLTQLCKQEDIGISALYDIAKGATDLAHDLGQPLEPQHIYACTCMSPKVQLSLGSVPADHRKDTWALTHVLSKRITYADYINDPSIVGDYTEESKVEDGQLYPPVAPANTTSPTPPATHQLGSATSDGKAPAATPGETGNEPEQPPKRREQYLPKESSARLLRYGLSVKKGVSHEESHRYVLSKAMVLTLALEGGLSEKRKREFLELNSMRGKASEIEEFKAGIIDLMDDLSGKLGVLCEDSRQTQDVIEALGESTDGMTALKELFAARGID